MNLIMQLGNFFFQILFAGAILFVVYFLFLLGDFRGGLDSDIGSLISILVGTILIAITIIICLIIGLPVRLNKKLNYWWKDHQINIVIGLSVGLVLLAISLINYYGLSAVRNNPNGEYYKPVSTFYLTLTIIGWFMTAFIALHIYPAVIIKKVGVWLKSK